MNLQPPPVLVKYPRNTSRRGTRPKLIAGAARSKKPALGARASNNEDRRSEASGVQTSAKEYRTAITEDGRGSGRKRSRRRNSRGNVRGETQNNRSCARTEFRVKVRKAPVRSTGDLVGAGLVRNRRRMFAFPRDAARIGRAFRGRYAARRSPLIIT